jgi:hypothetical protein
MYVHIGEPGHWISGFASIYKILTKSLATILKKAIPFWIWAVERVFFLGNGRDGR